MGGETKMNLAAYRERAEKMLSQDHFAMLGVPRTASDVDVQKAFLEAVKVWHPDRVPPDAAEAKHLVTRVFGKLEVARATLTDSARRRRYLEEIEKPVRKASESDLSAAEAELEFKKADAFLKRNDLATAERHLVRATQLAPNKAEYRAALVWTKLKPTSTRAELEAAAGELDRAIALDGACKRAFLYRAQVRKRLDRTREAYADFLKVAELEPSNIDAQREVRLYKMRQERSEPKIPVAEKNEDGGFFRKLFKR